MSIISAIALLGGIGAAGALVLNGVAKKFRVDEDPRIGEVESFLPGANCGACGCKGCHDFAVKCVASDTLDGLNCPGAGKEGMAKIAKCLGRDGKPTVELIATLKCAGTPETKTPLDAKYTGEKVCAIMNMTAGDYACLNSCLGCGDCVAACPWDAIKIDKATGLPTVDTSKCVGCAMCAKACPRLLIEMRPKGLRERRVWVACSNCSKGAIARKQCTVACIGCGLCAKTCPFGAITIANNLAYIDPALCKTCGKCIPVCPTHAIKSNNIAIKPKE